MTKLKIALALVASIFLVSCEAPVDATTTPQGTKYKEELLGEAPNGCAFYKYEIWRGRVSYEGRYVLCGDATADTHNCGKNCTSNTATVVNARARALSRLTAEDRKVLGLDQ